MLLPADEGLPEFALVEGELAVRSFDNDKQVVVLRADKGRGWRGVSPATALQLGEPVTTLAKIPIVVEDAAIGADGDYGGGVT